MAIEVVPSEAAKKAYVKPRLVMHGSVQKLTEKSHGSPTPSGSDSGSNVRFPIFTGGGKNGWFDL